MTRRRSTTRQHDIGGMGFSHPDAVYQTPATGRTGIFGAGGHRRRSRHRAHQAAGMGRQDRPDGHLHRRLRRQSIPTHRPRRHVGLQHQELPHENVACFGAAPRLPKLGDPRRVQRPIRTGPDRDLVGPRPRRHDRRHQHGSVAGAIGRGCPPISPPTCSTRSASSNRHRPDRPADESSASVDRVRVAPPLGPPIECEPELCPWSPELTAQALVLPIVCDRSTLPYCPYLAVSPDGTLVAYDEAADTLTWYEDEPRVVTVSVELPA